MSLIAFDKTAVQARIRRILDPVAGLLLRLGFSPDSLTLLGLVLSILAGIQAGRGRMLGAGLLLVFGGLCDILDGSMARRGGVGTRRGAFLDSTLDRLAEIAVFLGLLVHYDGRLFLQVMTLLALSGSLMTSYARARAEGLGIDCKVGLLERPERLILIIVGLLAAPLRIAGYGLLELVVIALVPLTYATTLQRIAHVVGRTGRAGPVAPDATAAAPPPADEESEAVGATGPPR
jgi:CDP-diacylglycerol--glycerol-3-phosphate 3-phosphatidyltransferase